MESVCERRIYPVTAAEYKLLEEIGQGVSATVYRALCLPFKEIVAIKALDLEKCNSNLDDIRREAVTMSLINHANVVRAFCSFVVEQRLWVVMPYMSGGSCLHIMKSFYIDGFEEAVIATLLKEVLKALEYLHRHGHIHRDVKAGNILVDGTGAVKLADFGVSACMFDTGDRQRSRKTFVGTPCWMAPEVMEQLHGYDFKADVWSFGITALELAHGHAPFSKYPPMKVLLMTLQNAPPGLDYERDKRFSKAFKEMISMCLVKDPSKRPTAEKLLRHSFFKHARTPDYICRHVLDGLPPLGDRIRNLKNADDARLAQQKLNFDEQEQRSQTEYKRGVSSWNFDVEDLKAQSALIPDDDNTPSQAAKEDAESAEFSSQPGSWDSGGSPERGQLPNYTQSLKVEVANGNGGYLTAPRNFPSSKPAGRCLSMKKEPKHIGRFDVFEDDNVLESPGWHNSPKNEHRRGEEREPRRFDEKERDESRRGTSGPLVPERVGSSVRGRDEDQDREFRHGRVSDRGSFSGPLVPTGERACLDHRPANGLSRPSSGVTKEALEEKPKGPAQKVPVVQRGRFSVTSDGGLEDLPHVSSRRNMCAQGSQQHLCVPAPSLSSSNLNGVSVPAVAIMPHLQNALQLAVMQQEALMHILNGINPSEAANSLRSFSNSKRSSDHSLAEIQNERERDHLQQIADLQNKLSQLLDEQKILKSRNVALERQLNAIYNKEEEERIRREEAAKEDG